MKVSKVSLTKEKFLIALDKGKKGYAQKPKSWQKIWYWWEDHSDAWFMNVYKEEKKGSLLFKNSSWIYWRITYKINETICFYVCSVYLSKKLF